MTNLLERKLIEYQTSKQIITLKLKDNIFQTGSITDVDGNYVCLSTDNNNELIFSIDEITQIIIESANKNIYDLLQTAYSSNKSVEIILHDDTNIVGKIVEFDEENIQIETENAEFIVIISQIRNIDISGNIYPHLENHQNNGQRNLESKDLKLHLEELSPHYDSEIITPIPTKSYLRIEASAQEIEHFLISLRWSKKKKFIIDRQCPISQRTNSTAATIWGKAINYHRDRSWAKAAEEFKKFSLVFTEKAVGYYNAAICFENSGDVSSALMCYEAALNIGGTTDCYLAGIKRAIEIGYWSLALKWLNDYLILTQGGDSEALLLIGFQMRLGLFNDALKTIIISNEQNYPISPLKGLKYVAYIVNRLSSPSEKLLTLIETHLEKNSISTLELTKICNQLLNIVSNQDSINFQSSLESELEWRKKQQKQNNKDHLLMLNYDLTRAESSQDLNKMVNLANQILAIEPNHSKAKSILQKKQTVPSKKSTSSSEFKKLKQSKNYDYKYRQANQLRQQGNLSVAKLLFNQCIVAGHNVENSVKNLANIYLYEGDYQRGIDLLKKHVPQAREKRSFYNLLGQIQYKAEDYQGAVDSYGKARDHQPDKSGRINPMMSMAAIYTARLSRPDRAKELLEKIIKIDPNHELAKNFLNQVQLLITAPNVQDVSLPTEINELINFLSRPVGTATVRISPFMRREIEERRISGLDRYRIERNEFTIEDANYLKRQGLRIKTSKPEQRYPYFISAAKVLSILDQEDDDQFREYLRIFCAAVGDYYVIHNRDVARTYFVEAFKLESRMTPQLFAKLKQHLMTFLYPDREVFLDKSLPKQSYELLADGLNPEIPDNTRINVARSIVAISRFNPDLINVLTTWVRDYDELQILNRFADALYLCNEKESPRQIEEKTLLDAITFEQEKISLAQSAIESNLQYFLDNTNNYQRMFETHKRFLDFLPNFQAIGVDFNNTDLKRINEMKAIINRYIDFYHEQVFEERQILFSHIINGIKRIDEDIQDLPTYYGRCYLQPLLRQWENVVRTRFEEIENSSKPNLEISEIVRCSRNDDVIEAHLLISNKEGLSSASGVKVEIIKSPNEEYQIENESYSIGTTISVGGDVTVPIRIFSNTSEPVLTLNCRLIYTSRDGEQVPSNLLAIPLRFNENEFRDIEDNPYSKWANGDAVDEDEMFKGRERLVAELVNAIQDDRQKKMIVIYGQKRAGKSSVLLHVARRLKYPIIPVEFSLGRISLNFTIENLFYHLARELYKSLYKSKEISKFLDKHELHKPKREDYLNDAFGVFVEYMESVSELLSSNILKDDILPVLIIDEFTYIYSNILEGELDSKFMRAWKSLVEKKFFSFLLSGIDEMPEFISTFPNEFGIADLRRVSYLDFEGARELIEQPIWDKDNNTSRFQESAIRQVMSLTANSAYYIQIFNNQLVRYMNNERTGYVTEADILRVLHDYLIKPGKGVINFDSNFDNLTRYKRNEQQDDEIEIEGKVLQIIAYLTLNQDFAGLKSIHARFDDPQFKTVESILNRLIDREVLISQKGHESYAIRVGLFKHWINTNMPYKEDIR